MPVPIVIGDLSTTAITNSPQGTDSAKGTIDDYFRAHASFIAQNRDGKVNTADLAASTGAALVGSAAWYAPNIVNFDATKVPNGATVIFSGRNTVGDPGAGTFTYYKTGIQTVDGGCIFAPTGGGRLIRDGWTVLGFNGLVSVGWYGALANWDGSTGNDDTSAIQSAINSGFGIKLLRGSSRVTRPILASRPTQVIDGFGMNISALAADSTFTSATVGGATALAVLWYQAPGLATATDWIEGGSFSNFGIACNSVKGVREVEGIRVNRVCINQAFQNLKIIGASVGINGTKYGWCTKFDNVYITDSVHIAVRLDNAYNGCTFINCFLFGATTSPLNANGSWTEVLLDMKNDCYGNSFTGGAIEGGRVGVRLYNAQLAVYGTDFEEITETFVEANGIYAIPPFGGGLSAANPTSTFNGCNFVGVPINGGIIARGASVVVEGNFFINSGALPGPGIYALNGIEGGDATITGFERVCISEKDNTARGWGNQFYTGNVASRMVRVITGGVTFPNPPLPSTDTRTLDDYNEGTFTPTDASGAGLVFTNAGGKFTKIGNMVFGNVEVTFPVTANATGVTIGGLPYVVGGAAGTFGANRGGIRVSYTDAGIPLGALLVTGNSQFVLFDMSGGVITNAQMSGKTIWLSLAYHV